MYSLLLLSSWGHLLSQTFHAQKETFTKTLINFQTLFILSLIKIERNFARGRFFPPHSLSISLPTPSLSPFLSPYLSRLIWKALITIIFKLPEIRSNFFFFPLNFQITYQFQNNFLFSLLYNILTVLLFMTTLEDFILSVPTILIHIQFEHYVLVVLRWCYEYAQFVSRLQFKFITLC